MKRLAILASILLILLTTATATVNGESDPDLTTSAVPVPVWSVGYDTYTAQFIGEDKVVVYTNHGDMDLGFRYVSTYGDAYIYDTKTGKLIKKLSADSDGDTFDLSTYTEIWDRSGVFSGNGRFLLEDPQKYGTNARVVDLETKTTYSIDWTGTAGSYYASQMDYYGSVFAVGENTNDGRVIVFERHGDTYEQIWKSDSMGQVRRLFLTLDGEYLVYGALEHPYLYIAHRTGSSYSIIKKIPLEGGVGALTCTDPYNIGYILVGTDNGHIYVFRFEVSEAGGYVFEEVLHLDSSQTGTTGRFYNPFYNRWNPIEVTVVAFSTNTDPYVSVLVDIHTGRYWVYSGSGYGKASSVSLEGNYLFAGRTLYMLVKQDIQSGEPRIRFEGDLIYNPTQSYPWELSTSFVLEAPKDKPYHIYFESGSIKITYVSAEERPVELITDSDIVNGKLGNMLDRGFVRYDVIYTDGATVKDHNLTKIDERTVIYERTHVLQTWTYARFFGVPASTADSGVVIEVPLDVELTPYSELTLDPKFAVAIVIPQFNPFGELMGVGGQVIGSGASLYTAKSLAKGWLNQYLRSKGVDILETSEWVSRFGKFATTWGARALFIVGVALAVDAGVEFYTHYENLKEYENIKTTVYTIPILIDSKTGEKYAVVEYFLPRDASEHESDFKDHVISYLERLGIPSSNIKIRVSYITDTWDDYMDLIEAGKIPKTNLLELSKMITEVPTERLRIYKIIIIIDTITSGYASTFDLLGGGYHEALATIVYGNSIQVSGIISGFSTKDPEEIASLIPKVEINGQEYSVSPSTDGAIAQFTLPIGTDKLVVKFPNAEHLRAIFQLKATTLVKTPMVDRGGYYEANFHYDWKYGDNNLVIITKRMEFVDMPYPMEYAEREIKLLYGRVEPLEITNYFELSQVINDPDSPSGKRYYYVTQDPKFLDPSNGARMQTCKQYIFRYWYVTPPVPYPPDQNQTIPINETEPLPDNYTSSIGNAWIKLYLNGTSNASVIPRMLVVWVGSTGNERNTISVKVNMRAGYLDSEDRPVYTMNETRTFTVTVPPNSTYVQFYDVQKFIAEAIEYAPRGFFEAIGVITQATYNKVISDDADRITYFPPPTLPPTETLVFLGIKVVDAFNLTPIQGAKVYLDGSLFETTNADGWANGTTTTGLHKIKVEKSGYNTYEGDLNVFDNMTVTITLTPKGTVVNPVGEYTLTVVVRDHRTRELITYPVDVFIDGKLIGTTTTGVLKTSVSAGCHKIYVRSTKDYEPYEADICIYQNTTYTVYLIRKVTPPPTPTTVSLNIRVIDGTTLDPIEGAKVYLDGSLFGTTNTEGWANGTIETGLYKIRVEKYGYNPYECNLSIADNTTIYITLTPTGTVVNPPNPPTEIYTLTVKAIDAINKTPVAGATVYLDGEVFGTTGTDGITTGSVKSGCHNLTVTHPDYQTYSDTVCVFENMTYFVSLIPKTVTPPPTPTTVSLNIRVIDGETGSPIPNAEILLNSSSIGFTNVDGWLNTSVTTGVYQIEVKANGYLSYKSVIEVYDNTTYVISLTKLPSATFYTLEVLVQYQDGAPFEGAKVTVLDNTTQAEMFNATTDFLGLAKFLIEYERVVDVHITADSYTFNFTGIVMDKNKRIVATVPENSSYFTPEVAISNVTLKIHWGMGWYYGETPHLVETWVFSNIPQTITLHYRAFDIETNETLNETDLTVNVHKGMTYVMNWVYLAVRNETKNVAVEVTITSYEQDTNLENNKMVSNNVTIKPFVDLSVTVLWKPIRQKTPLAILPEDVIEIDIGFMIPCKLSGIEIRADVNMHDLFTKKLRPLERHHDVIASFKPNTTIWYNTTVVVPFTDKIVVNASIYHPWEYMGWNNYINTTIPIFPDTEVSEVSIGALLVQSGQDVDVTVKLRSNAIGRGTTISVFDEDVGDVIGTAHVEITEPEMEVKLKAKAPVIGASVKTEQFNFSGVYETHTWNVSSATADYWTENDYKTIQVTIWNIPWWVWVLIALIVIIFILAIVHALLTTVKERTRPRYRFFRRLEGEEVSDRFGLTTEEKGYKKFRFFRKLK